MGSEDDKQAWAREMAQRLNVPLVQIPLGQRPLTKV